MFLFILFNPLPHRDTLLYFCKHSRPHSDSSCKRCLINVYSVCLLKYDIFDPTPVDPPRNIFILWANMKIYLYNHSLQLESSMNIHEGKG